MVWIAVAAIAIGFASRGRMAANRLFHPLAHRYSITASLKEEPVHCPLWFYDQPGNCRTIFAKRRDLARAMTEAL